MTEANALNTPEDRNAKIVNIDTTVDPDEIRKEKEHIEKYLSEQRDAIKNHIVGAADYAGNKISRVYSRTDEFVIYETQDVPPHESIRVYIHSKKEDDETKIIRFQQCKEHFDDFVAHCYRYNCTSIYRKRAATILSSILLGIHDPSINNFFKINEDIRKDYENTMQGRNLYQLGAVSLAIMVILASVIIYLCRKTDFITHNHFLPVVFYAAAFASMGGFISVSLKIKSLHTDRELNGMNYFFYGSERILFSMIAGVLVYFMLKGNFIFGFLNADKDISFSLYIICALSGFSETLIPNTLRNLETKSEEKS